MGTFAVQITKAHGANVTGVCSTRNLEMVRSLGAERVIDYTQEDFAQAGRRFDLIFDVVAKRSFSDCSGALGPRGIYVTTAFTPGLTSAGLWTSVSGRKKLVPFLAKSPNAEDLVFLSKLLEGGNVTPVIDRRYPLGEVPDALRYLGKGHARGKVVIAM